MADFVKVLVDLFWAFADIWYHFFMIFINAWLYLYYFMLFIVDKLTVSGFSKRASARHALPGSGAIPGLPSPKFGKFPAHPHSPAKAAESVVKVAQAAARTVTPRGPSGAKKSVTKEAAKASSDIVRRIGMTIVHTVKKIAEFLSFRMRPVREEGPSDKKSLIDEYMREYERKKR